MNGSTIGAHPCNIFFQVDPVTFSYDQETYDLSLSYIWEVSDIEFPNSNTVIITNDILQSDETILTLTVDILLENQNDSLDIFTCQCFESYDISVIVDNYEHFSCDCQPNLPEPTFEVDYLIDCGGGQILFNNTTDDLSSYVYEWAINDDDSQTTSITQDFGITFLTDDESPTESFVISMSATDADSCTATITQAIEIPQPPNLCDSVDFELNFLDSLPCDLMLGIDAIDFEYDTTQYELVTNYIWDTGGLSIDGTNEVIVPNNYALNYDDLNLTLIIDLININAPGESFSCICLETYSLQEIIDNYDYFSCECQPGGAPIADFNVVNEGGCGNQGINFQNTSIGGLGSNYYWEFGPNGIFGTSVESSPTEDIIIDGGWFLDIPITLSITDLNDCQSSVTQLVEIGQTPNPGEDLDVAPICSNFSAQADTSITLIFTPEPFGGGGIDYFYIDWGLGDTLLYTPPPIVPTFDITSPDYSNLGSYPINIDLYGLNGCVNSISSELFIGSNPQLGSTSPGNTTGLCSPVEITYPVYDFQNNAASTIYTIQWGDETSEEYTHQEFLDLIDPTTGEVYLSHLYEISSCGYTSLSGVQNSFFIMITADNDCDATNFIQDPVQINLEPSPLITGDTITCVNQPTTFTSPSTGTSIDDDDECQNGKPNWYVLPLQGQIPPNPSTLPNIFSPDTSSIFTTSFLEPGLYQINVLEQLAACSNGQDDHEICVYPDILEPIESHFPNNGCIPLEVTLTDLTPPLSCGTFNREWVIQNGAFEWAAGSGPNSESPTIVLLEPVDYQISLIHTPPENFLPSNCNITGESSFIIEAYDIPEILIDADDYFICETEEVTSSIIQFDDGNYDIYVINWFVDGVYHSSDSSEIEPIIVPLNSFGEHSIEATATNVCGVDSSNISVLVYENPEITTTSLPGECLGSTIEIGAFGADDYSWSSNNPIISNSGNSAIYLASGSTTETVTGTINYQFESCSSDTTFDIIAYPLPVIDIIGDFSICDQEELDLTTSISDGTPDYDVSWSEDNLSLIDENFITIADQNITSLTAYVVDDNGCEGSDEINVEVYSLPIVDAGPDVQFCNQSILTTLSDNNPFGGVWDGLGIQNEFTGEVDPSVIGVGTSLIYYEYTDLNGCENADSLTIEVIPPTFAEAGPDIAVCNIDTIIIQDSYTPIGGNWTGDFIGNSVSDSLDISNFDSGLYQFFYDFGEGTCFTQDAMILEVYERPNVYWDGPESLCLYESGIFELTIEGGTGPYFIEWLSDVDLIVNDGYTIANSWDFVGIQELELFVTDSNGCSNYLSFAIDVIDLPFLDAGPDTTFCFQTNYTAQLEGFYPGLNENGNGMFYGLGDAQGAVSPEGEVDPSLTGPGLFEVVYQFTSAITGCVNTDTIDVQITNLEIAFAGPDTTVCFNAPQINLEDYYPTEGVLWTAINGTPLTALSDNQLGVINPQFLPVGEYDFLLEYGTGTCYTNDTVSITTLALPEISLDSQGIFCSNNGVVSLTQATPQGGVWEGNGVVDEDTGTFNSGVGTGTYDLIYWYLDESTTCSDTASHSVLIQDVPTVYAGPDIELCNQSILTNLDGYIPGLTDGGEGIFYGLGPANLAVSPDGTINPFVTGVGVFEAVYQFTSSATGCINTDTLEFEVIDPVIANAGLDFAICNNSPDVQFEDYTPETGGTWFVLGNTPESALLDQINGIINPQNLLPGIHEFLLEYGEESCYTSDTVSITIIDLPNVEVIENDEFCSNDGIVQLSETSLPGGTWEGEGLIDDALGTFNSNQLGGIYDLIYWYTDTLTLCSDTALHQVVINDIPQVFAGNDLLLCNQPINEQLIGNFPLNNDGGIGVFTGLGEAVNAITDGGEFDPIVSGNGEFDIVYTFTSDETGCFNSDTLMVSVSPPIPAYAGEDVDICINIPEFELLGSPTIGSNWFGETVESNAAIIDASSGLIDPTLLSPGEHSFMIEFGTGTCYSSDTVVVTIDSLPILNVTGSDVFCVNEGEVSLSSFSPFGGTWEGDGVVDSQAGTFNSGIGVGDWDLIYWYTDPLTSCSDTTTHVVTILDIPTVFAGDDVEFCNQPIPSTLEGFSPGLSDGGSGEFYGLGDAFGAISPDGIVDPSFTGVGSFEVVYQFTSNATGCTNTDTLTYTVVDPTIAVAGPDTTVCYNAPLLQLENFYPLSSVTWSGLSAEASVALLDSETGLINPQLLLPGDYEFMIEFGTGTCYTTDVLVVSVEPLPEIYISSDDSFCGNLGSQILEEPSPTGGTWFGLNVLDSQSGLYNTLQPAGSYQVNYTYTDQTTQCADTVIHDVEIYPVPDSQFGFDTLGCNNLVYPFSQLSTGANVYEWEFGNSATSEEPSPTYIYPDIGEYVVTLYASNNWGCEDTTSAVIEVTELPIASFSLNTDLGCAPLFLSVSDESYSPYSSYEWELNGQSFTGSILPDQVLTQGDSIILYDLQLTLTNLCGESLNTQEITVLPQPEMEFNLQSEPMCSPYTATIQYAGVGLPTYIEWDYGNGQTSTGASPLSPTYIVDSLTTTYTITLTGENECGTDTFSLPIEVQPNDVLSIFSTSTTDGCPPLEVVVNNLSLSSTDVSFDFGDGNYFTGEQATNIYEEEGEYTLIQYVDNGCSYDTSEIVITVHPEPEFALISESDEVCEGDEATFSVDAISPGGIEWDFGDGGAANGISVNYTFFDSGLYDVEATVLSNIYGCVGVESFSIEVFPTPVLNIEPSALSGCSPLPITFQNETSVTSFWTWDFGDSTPNGVEETPTHTFTNNSYVQQSFDVTVDALTINGCSTNGEFTIDVLPEPIAAFDISDQLLCGLPSTIYLSNLSDGTSLQYQWSVNNQEAGGAFQPSFEVNNYGDHLVELLVTNLFGCTATASESVAVYSFPSPEILMTPSAGCAPLQVAFNDISSGSIGTSITIANADWLIYNGPVPNFPLTINQSGNFVLNMVSISAEGCESELEIPEIINVWPEPNVDFDVVPLVYSSFNPNLSHPSNTAFEFLNLTTGHESSYWEFGNGGVSTEESPVFDFILPGSYHTTLTATSEHGCVSSHSEMVTISTELEIYVPNSFTPPFEGSNSKGINDAWRPEFSNLDVIESYNIQIYNRWGMLVWESDDPEEYWLGEAGENGQYYSQNDVYTYVIKVNSNTWVDKGKELRGFITILR
ncbi:MAG: hypothetical protein CL823_03125 [Crocinitomicaceae bacterium]|nr:hypothetical protein [Crocinitomicaceae bacterium]